MSNARLPDDVEKLNAELVLGVAPPVEDDTPDLNFYITKGRIEKWGDTPGGIPCRKQCKPGYIHKRGI